MTRLDLLSETAPNASENTDYNRNRQLDQGTEPITGILFIIFTLKGFIF